MHFKPKSILAILALVLAGILQSSLAFAIDGSDLHANKGLTVQSLDIKAQSAAHTQAEAVAWANEQVSIHGYGNPLGDGQCVWLTYFYYQYLGQAGPTCYYASDYANGSAQYVPSGWSYQNSPQPGDIAVWSGTPGHVAIVTEIRGSQMVCVEQNYAGKLYCTPNLHNIDAQTYIRPDWSSSSSFSSYVDDVQGVEGGIYFRGWTYNNNNLTRSTQIHVYLDGPLGVSTTSWAVEANVARTDVDAAYHVGAYHGFDTTISGISPGNHTVYIYANDQYLNQHEYIGSYNVTVAGSSPVCSDFHVGELREGAFTVFAKVTAASGIREVKYAIWTEKDGQDDIQWYQGNHTGNDNVWWARVNFGDHKWERGKYIIHLYAYSTTGELTNPGITYEFKESGPSISDVRVSEVSAKGYTVTCKVVDSLGVLRVQFPTWTIANDSDDLVTDWSTNAAVRGSVSGDTATFRVNTSDHNAEVGSYRTHIYAYDILGNQTSVPVPDVFVHDHSFSETTTPATLTADGEIKQTCGICGEANQIARIGRIASVTPSATQYTYNGKVRRPTITVKSSDGKLVGSNNYDVIYSNPTSTNVGSYSATVKFKGSYAGSKRVTFKINKAKNPMAVKAKSPSVKASKVKKANRTIAAKKAFSINKAKGKVIYKKISGNKKITVTSAGKITVKKGLKKGTYRVKVKVTAKGNANYKSGSKTVTVKIIVK